MGFWDPQNKTYFNSNTQIYDSHGNKPVYCLSLGKKINHTSYKNSNESISTGATIPFVSNTIPKSFNLYSVHETLMLIDMVNFTME